MMNGKLRIFSLVVAVIVLIVSLYAFLTGTNSDILMPLVSLMALLQGISLYRNQQRTGGIFMFLVAAFVLFSYFR